MGEPGPAPTNGGWSYLPGPTAAPTWEGIAAAPAVAIRELAKRFGTKVAVADVSLDVPRGSSSDTSATATLVPNRLASSRMATAGAAAMPSHVGAAVGPGR